MRFISALPLLAPLLATFAAADEHRWCECWTWDQPTGWIYNWELTAGACDSLSETAYYNDKRGQCMQRPASDYGTPGHESYHGQGIDGDKWEGLCVNGAKNGYHEGHDNNKPLKHSSASYGHCQR